MKKHIIVLVLLIIAANAVFADASHPDGFGIGILWRGNMNWSGGGFGVGGAALSLKIPSIPIYWGANAGLGSGWFSVGLTGDKYLAGGRLGIYTYWYIGLGGYVGVWSGTNDISVNFGLRLPIGLSWQVLKRVLEFYIEAAPSLGVNVWTRGQSGMHFPGGGITLSAGIRVWVK